MGITTLQPTRIALTKASERARARAQLVACVLAVCSAPAAGVEFEPYITAGIARTDNIQLTSEDPEGQTVYELAPGFDLSQESPGVKADVAYRLQSYRYDQRRDGETFHDFNGEVQVAPDRDNFFVDMGASRTQTLKDPEGRIIRTNLPINDNRINRNEYYLGPSLQYGIGGSVTASGSFRRTWTKYDVDDSGSAFDATDVTYDHADFSFDNYRRGRGFTWAMRYATDTTEYEQFPPWEYRQALVELGVWAGEAVRVFLSGGKESAWDQPLDPSLQEGFWEIGFARESARLNVELATGDRSYGPSFRGQLDYNFARGNMGFSYSKTATTQGEQRQPRGFLARNIRNIITNVDDFLERPGSAERFISTRLRWRLSIELRRTRLSFEAFDETREERVSIGGTPLGDESQSGENMDLRLEAGRRTELFITGQRANQAFGENARDRRILSASVGAAFDFGQRTQVTVSYEYSEEESGDDAAFAQGNYDARLLSMTLTRSF